jgi:hypothetical protein
MSKLDAAHRRAERRIANQHTRKTQAQHRKPNTQAIRYPGGASHPQATRRQRIHHRAVEYRPSGSLEQARQPQKTEPDSPVIREAQSENRASALRHQTTPANTPSFGQLRSDGSSGDNRTSNTDSGKAASHHSTRGVGRPGSTGSGDLQHEPANRSSGIVCDSMNPILPDSTQRQGSSDGRQIKTEGIKRKGENWARQPYRYRTRFLKRLSCLSHNATQQPSNRDNH